MALNLSTLAAPQTMSVYHCGSGPGVLLMYETPSSMPEVQESARRIAAIGSTVHMPWMFGTPNKPVSAGYTVKQILDVQGYLSLQGVHYPRARRRSSPITNTLRTLERQIHTECGGPGVGAVDVSDRRFRADPDA